MIKPIFKIKAISIFIADSNYIYREQSGNY